MHSLLKKLHVMYTFGEIKCALIGGLMTNFMFGFAVTLITALSALASRNCAIKAESYIVGEGKTFPAALVDETRDGDLVFNVRAIEKGAASVFEVTVNEACDLVTMRLLERQ